MTPKKVKEKNKKGTVVKGTRLPAHYVEDIFQRAKEENMTVSDFILSRCMPDIFLDKAKKTRRNFKTLEERSEDDMGRTKTKMLAIRVMEEHAKEIKKRAEEVGLTQADFILTRCLDLKIKTRQEQKSYANTIRGKDYGQSRIRIIKEYVRADEDVE